MCGIIASYAFPSIRAESGEKAANCYDGVEQGSLLQSGVEIRQEDAMPCPERLYNSMYSQLQKSLELIKHRGPDGSAVWINADLTVGLGHCRLAINDLSSAGAQPMHTANDKIHAVVNGEIYDYDDVLQHCISHGYRPVGRSDSELVLALYSIHGAPEMFDHLRGEFAFVILDEREHKRKIVAGRDRFGVKPLFWTVQNDKVLFASEAKAFLGLGWVPEWDVQGIVTSGWLADERTLFKGVRKLLPGRWMELTDEYGPRIRQYWDPHYPDKTKIEKRTTQEMILRVRELLVEAVRLRLRAGVPMGIYLSGGIDSSAIAGIATHLVRYEHQEFGSSTTDNVPRIKCFTVRYPDVSYDESEVAMRTAEELGAQCLTTDIDEQRLADNFEDATYCAEQHHFDLNSTAKYALSSLAREHGVKAVLTGEGSDELFAGYSQMTPDFLREVDATMPTNDLLHDPDLRRPLQRDLISEIEQIMRPQGAKLYCGPADTKADLENDMTLASLLSCFPRGPIFADWVQADEVDMRTAHRDSFSPQQKADMQHQHPLHNGLRTWNQSMLPGMILTCLGDRSEMGHSIEGRPPFLDHHLADYANSLPPSVKMKYLPPGVNQSAREDLKDYWWKDAGSALRSVTQKWVLREAVKPFITQEMYERRKIMFLTPIRWKKNGPLHSMFKGLLTEEAVLALGFVSWPHIEKALERGFGETADGASFRAVLYVAGWVTISKRFGVNKATPISFGSNRGLGHENLGCSRENTMKLPKRLDANKYTEAA